MRILFVLMMLASCGHQLPAATKLLSSTIWTDTHPRFGGFSGLHLSDDGTRFTALSDRGVLLATGTFTRINGQITAISKPVLIPMRKPNGKLQHPWADSEGLAIAADGTIFISPENNHRTLFEYDTLNAAKALRIPAHPDFANHQHNASLEALAIGPDRALYTIPERSGRANWPFPVYRYKDGAWDIPFTIPRTGNYLVVGADIGPDNRFYILERHFTGIGFQSRVRRFNMDGADAETLLATANGTHDNLEGISVWRDAENTLRMTMISDDNFRFFQQTQIVEYQISD